MIKSLWPKVQFIGRGSRWLPDTRVVEATMIEGFMESGWPWEKYRLKAHPHRCLIVRLRPRTNYGSFNWNDFTDASFVLHGVILRVSNPRKMFELSSLCTIRLVMVICFQGLHSLMSCKLR